MTSQRKIHNIKHKDTNFKVTIEIEIKNRGNYWVFFTPWNLRCIILLQVLYEDEHFCPIFNSTVSLQTENTSKICYKPQLENIISNKVFYIKTFQCLFFFS